MVTEWPSSGWLDVDVIVSGWTQETVVYMQGYERTAWPSDAPAQRDDISWINAVVYISETKWPPAVCVLQLFMVYPFVALYIHMRPAFVVSVNRTMAGIEKPDFVCVSS